MIRRIAAKEAGVQLITFEAVSSPSRLTPLSRCPLVIIGMVVYQ
jgi:hypothetical protein